MQSQIQSALQQAIINQLMPESVSFIPVLSFTGIKRNGIMHNALTAHAATTHIHWTPDGYQDDKRIDIIPQIIPSSNLTILAELQAELLADSDLNDDQLPACLQRQAY